MVSDSMLDDKVAQVKKSAIDTRTGPHVVYNMPEAEYHADPCSEPSLSQSLAHTLLMESARHAWLRHPRLGGSAPELPNMRLRHAFHDLVLRGGAAVEIHPTAPDWRLKATRDWMAATRDAGRIPLLAKEAVNLRPRVTVAREELGMAEFATEVSIFWSDGDASYRHRLDAVAIDGLADDGLGAIVDLKFVRSVSPSDFARSIYLYGYDIQAAAYLEAIQLVHPARRWDFYWLLVEKDTGVCWKPRIGAETLHIGRFRWSAAKAKWKHCLATDQWDGPKGQTVDMAGWAMARCYELEADSEWL